ncbi:glycosyltransferase family 2 protein [Peribacillus frigoritolerans]|uniref:glycosyltransferase family A protein n=1 Tax=Peribacillus frigoritolerans TaxID=450367 RepID=UPI001EFE18D5|nr:glycosyltransferase family A protein [Peribacillus frigoritolerans]ULM95688.1 glycosyltransferase family 2 protein [Peribacillus frigoritolerans]
MVNDTCGDFITIITPTYNRAYLLDRLYKSLLNQTNKKFLWLIIDDGSNDNTKQLVGKFISDDVLSIKYIYKENGGKHTALNLGISEIHSLLTFIVDSDDYLTEDAIEKIMVEWDKIKHLNLCGLSFLKGYSETNVVGKKYPKDYMVDNYIDIRINKKIHGDKAEVWVTKLLKETPFPEFEGEKFIGESVVWSKIANDYDMLFINRIIYICEYMEDGLTKAGRKLRINCPLGRMETAKVSFLSTRFSRKSKIKDIWIYICHGFFANKNVKYLMKDSGIPLLVLLNLPFGFILYKFWKIKYI